MTILQDSKIARAMCRPSGRSPWMDEMTYETIIILREAQVAATLEEARNLISAAIASLYPDTTRPEAVSVSPPSRVGHAHSQGALEQGSRLSFPPGPAQAAT